MPDTFMDAQAALGFVQSQTSHIESVVYQKKYPQIRYLGTGPNGIRGLIPVDTSASAYADSVTYYSMDYAGSPKWASDKSNDSPVVSIQTDSGQVSLEAAELGYDFGFFEIGQAQMLGINLSTDKPVMVRTQVERFIDTLLFEGDSKKGMDGLLGRSDVTQGAATGGVWSGLDGDGILTAVNDLLISVHTDTNTVAMADTLLLPWQRLQTIGSKRIGDTNMTILQFLRENNAFTATTGQPLDIRGVRGLDTAAAGDTARMIAYRNDPEVLRCHMPMPLRFLPPQAVGTRIVVPGLFKVSGLDVRLPKEIAYGDGI